MQLTSKKQRQHGEPIHPPRIVADNGLRGGAFLAAAAALVAWGIFIVAIVLVAGGPAQ